MVSLVGFLKRPEGVSRGEFQRWWVEEHVPFVKQVPGLRRYVVHVVTNGYKPEQGVGGTVTEDAEFDGIAELWFDDLESLQNAWSSPKGTSDLDHFKKYAVKTVAAISEPKVVIAGP